MVASSIERAFSDEKPWNYTESTGITAEILKRCRHW